MYESEEQSEIRQRALGDCRNRLESEKTNLRRRCGDAEESTNRTQAGGPVPQRSQRPKNTVIG
jgi:hypothetical protein